MNIVKSAVNFNGYRVLYANYESKAYPKDENEIKIDPKFNRIIRKVSNNEYALILGIQIKSTEDDANLPFDIEVVIEGNFILENVENHEKTMKINATAIMFPYLRSTLSMLTTLMNINPVVLPTINLIKMFQDDEEQGEANVITEK